MNVIRLFLLIEGLSFAVASFIHSGRLIEGYIGVGPRTVPDIVYHIALLITLALGLAVTARVPQSQRTSKAERTS